MVDLYDDRPNQYNNTEGVNEGHSLQDRISMSGNEHYSGHEGDRAMVPSISNISLFPNSDLILCDVRTGRYVEV